MSRIAVLHVVGTQKVGGGSPIYVGLQTFGSVSGKVVFDPVVHVRFKFDETLTHESTVAISGKHILELIKDREGFDFLTADQDSAYEPKEGLQFIHSQLISREVTEFWYDSQLSNWRALQSALQWRLPIAVGCGPMYREAHDAAAVFRVMGVPPAATRAKRIQDQAEHTGRTLMSYLDLAARVRARMELDDDDEL